VKEWYSVVDLFFIENSIEEKTKGDKYSYPHQV
jgi:hypothetical protein